MQAAASAPNLFFGSRCPGGRFGGGPSGRLPFDSGQGRLRRTSAGPAAPKRHGHVHGRGHAHGQGQAHPFDHSHAGGYFSSLNGHFYTQGSAPGATAGYDLNHNGTDAGCGASPSIGLGPGPGLGPGSGPGPGPGPGTDPGAPLLGGRGGPRRGRGHGHGHGRGRRGGHGHGYGHGHGHGHGHGRGYGHGHGDGHGQGHAHGHGSFSSVASSGPSSGPSSSHSSTGSPRSPRSPRSPHSPRSSRSRHSSQSSRSTPSPLSPPPAPPPPPQHPQHQLLPQAASPASASSLGCGVYGALGPHSRNAGDGRRRGRLGGTQPRAVAVCQLKHLPPPPPPQHPHPHAHPPPPNRSPPPAPRAGAHGPPPGAPPPGVPPPSVPPPVGHVRYSYVSTFVRYEKTYVPQRAHNAGKKMVSNEQLAEDCMIEMGKGGSFYYSAHNIAQMVKQWPHAWQPPMRKPWRVEKYPPRLFQGSEWDEVSRDIWDKYSRNKQKQTSYEKKVNICRMLSSVLEPVHPGYMFLVTGSTLNGFGTERSDLDICLLVDDSNGTSRDEALAHLERIKQTLNDDPSMTKRAELILAKVPILKFRDARWDVEVDINCNSNVAIRNTHLLYCYSICDWRVRPLVTIVKLWAARHRINDAKNMTISSYSLVLMVIHFLQCGVSPPVLPCLGELYPDMFSWQRHVLEIDVHQPPPEYFQSMNNQPLGKLLLDFFQYYLQFDYSRFALSVRLGTKIPIEECQLAQEVNNGVRQKPLLCIEEPFERTNTAYAVHNHEVFGRITAVFRSSYTELQKTKHLSSIFKRVPQLTY